MNYAPLQFILAWNSRTFLTYIYAFVLDIRGIFSFSMRFAFVNPAHFLHVGISPVMNNKKLHIWYGISEVDLTANSK